MQLKSLGIIALGLALGLGCRRPPEFEQQAATTWLDSHTEPGTFDVSGEWESTAFYLAGGWGSGTWIQNDNQVKGNLGLYIINGRVSGQKLYMLISSGNRVYYTALLEPTKDGGLLVGMAYPNQLADAKDLRLTDQVPVSLRRPSKP
jgi:hypothetical protein